MVLSYSAVMWRVKGKVRKIEEEEEKVSWISSSATLPSRRSRPPAAAMAAAARPTVCLKRGRGQGEND